MIQQVLASQNPACSCKFLEPDEATPWLNCNFIYADAVTRRKGGTSCRYIWGKQDHRNHEISEVFTA